MGEKTTRYEKNPQTFPVGVQLAHSQPDKSDNDRPQRHDHTPSLAAIQASWRLKIRHTYRHHDHMDSRAEHLSVSVIPVLVQLFETTLKHTQTVAGINSAGFPISSRFLPRGMQQFSPKPTSWNLGAMKNAGETGTESGYWLRTMDKLATARVGKCIQVTWTLRERSCV